ncbi:MAG: 4-hydroxy-3-methylbut-2-en-1-yl diphosphate synthase [Epsilonproteobacteria bacterium]|nr:4-hydroxy-3-methylbut-2-en-1-yl diphosphate synthase [Campylobacterota bacterium]
MKKNQETNYWPHAILGIIITVVIAGAYSINIAVHNPVQESTYFMQKYQSVEDNAYELEKQKDKFDKKYEILYSIKKFRIGKNDFSLMVVDKATKEPVNNAKITLLLTRPETNELNKKAKPVSVKGGNYIFASFDITRLGRWKILTKTKIEGYEGYNSYDINATRK